MVIHTIAASQQYKLQVVWLACTGSWCRVSTSARSLAARVRPFVTSQHAARLGIIHVHIDTVVIRRCSDTRLRSSSRGDFCIPQTNLRLSDKAFSIAGPRAWNSTY